MVDNPQSFSVKDELLFTRSCKRLTVRDLLRDRSYLRPFGWKDCQEITIHWSWEFERNKEQGSHRLLLFPQSSRFGGQRYWVICPMCGIRRYALYFNPYRGGFACRVCYGLRYMSKTLSKPAYLAHHYERLWESLDHRPGPKPRRYWRYLERMEEFDVAFIAKIEKRLRHLPRTDDTNSSLPQSP